jgi:hypothetical protein
VDIEIHETHGVLEHAAAAMVHARKPGRCCSGSLSATRRRARTRRGRAACPRSSRSRGG